MPINASILRCGPSLLRSRHLRWLLLFAPAVLAACGSDDAAPPPCPKVVVVEDASKQFKFKGSGRDLTDVVFESRIAAAGLSCEYDDDVLVVEMRVEVEAARGPAETERKVAMKYFVAISDRTRHVVAREAFDVNVPFPGNRTRVTLTEEIEPRIPLKPAQTGLDYVIFVGLELSEDELQYNRANR